MFYIVIEFVKNGEMFGKLRFFKYLLKINGVNLLRIVFLIFGFIVFKILSRFFIVFRTAVRFSDLGVIVLFCRFLDYLIFNGYLSENEVRKKFWQILLVVEYCYSYYIVYRDFKIENLLLDGNMDIKLVGKGFVREGFRVQKCRFVGGGVCRGYIFLYRSFCYFFGNFIVWFFVLDFGFGNFYKLGEFLFTWCGSFSYVVSEVFEGKEYEGFQLDVWVGVFMYGMCYLSVVGFQR